VGSVVGFIQEVVAGGTGADHQSSSINSKRSGSSMSANQHHSGAPSMNEIKESIEWLHFEHVGMLDRSSHGSHLYNNILLVLGYKTGFSIWSIDVDLASFYFIFFFF
jgi:hypothetical protein